MVALTAALAKLTATVEKHMQTTIDTAIYHQNMTAANLEQEGRASLARYIFASSVSLCVVFAGAVYAAHNGVPTALIIAKGICFVGALFSAMCVESGNDRWKYEQIALSNAIGLEKRGIGGDGIATKKRDAYETPTLMPGRVNAAGAAASTFWAAAYFVLVYMH
jgi:hypothetical protein